MWFVSLQIIIEYRLDPEYRPEELEEFIWFICQLDCYEYLLQPAGSSWQTSPWLCCNSSFSRRIWDIRLHVRFNLVGIFFQDVSTILKKKSISDVPLTKSAMVDRWIHVYHDLFFSFFCLSFTTYFLFCLPTQAFVWKTRLSDLPRWKKTIIYCIMPFFFFCIH